MTQQQLDREVAQATGESLATVRRHGFSLVTPLSIFDPDIEEFAWTARRSESEAWAWAAGKPTASVAGMVASAALR